MDKIKVVCLRKICSDGTEQYEMVAVDTGKCINYFPNIDSASDFAKEHGFSIVEWVMD